MKRPSFQFYPGDWLNDAALRSVSAGARGLWMDLMCLMHQSEPYGHLMINSEPMNDDQIARCTGVDKSVCNLCIKELEGAGVASRGKKNELFSRRMVRDERLRSLRASSGKLGGNPRLLNLPVNHAVNHTSKQTPTPSSSSSQDKEAAPYINGSPAKKCWLEVRTAIRNGRLPDKGWTDPRIQPTLDAVGGWSAMLYAESRELDFKQHEFVKAWPAQ